MGLKKLRSLDDLAPPDREVCQLLSCLGMVFNTTELIKLEYNPKHLKGYIGILFDSTLSCLLAYYVSLLLMRYCFLCRRGAKRGEEEDAS